MKLQPDACGAPVEGAAFSRQMLKRLAIASTLVGASLLSASAQADVVLLGSDYFETIQPTFFAPLGAANPLAGLPIGPGTTDTIVQRQGDCTLSLVTAGSSCTIPIEMVALSLVSTMNPMIQLRETPGSVAGTSRSGGTMTMASDGSGTGGTFLSSFFDVFVDLSIDGGSTFTPLGNVGPLSSAGTQWTTIAPALPELLVPGLRGDQNANLHTDKGDPLICPTPQCVDFFLVGIVTESKQGATHTAQAARVPEPVSSMLFGAALGLLVLARRWRRALV